MQIEKILNNNVVQAMDNDVEYIVMVKGLGFQKRSERRLIKRRLKRPLSWKIRRQWPNGLVFM